MRTYESCKMTLINKVGVDNDNVDNECCICFDKKQSKSTSCTICKNSICITCFEKLLDVDFDEDIRKAKMKIVCPVCRSEYTKNSTQFTRNELVSLCTSLVQQQGECWDFFLNGIMKQKKQYNKLASLAKQQGVNFNNAELPEYL